MTKRDLSALTLTELQEEFKRNRRRYWRLVVPQMVSFFGLLGIAFGVTAAFGVASALVVIALAAIAWTGWMVPVGALMFSQNRLGFEMARRQRSAGP